MTAPVENRPEMGMHIPLTSRHTPLMQDRQLRLYHYDNLGIHKTDEGLHPWRLNSILRRHEGQQVFGISIGQERAVVLPFQVETGRLIADTDRTITVEGEQSGKFYLPILEAVALAARNDQIPVGIATGGTTRQTRLTHFPELPDFMESLRHDYDGNFSNCFPTLAAVNSETQAGLKALTIHGDRLQGPKRGIVLISNGETFTGGVFKDGMVFPMQPGTVPAIDAGNQPRFCTNHGIADYVCVDHAGASKTGIENLWYQVADREAHHLSIDDAYRQGNTTAANLYDRSALMAATAALGMARSVWLMQGENDTIVALDGNMFETPSYGKRVMQILTRSLGFESPFLFTNSVSPNIAAEGAALAALISYSRHNKTT